MDREKKKELLKKYKDGNVTRFRKTKGGGKEYYNLNDYKRKDKESENESRIMNKKLIRLTESELHQIVKESVKRVLNEMRPETYASYAKGREAQGQMDKAQVGRQAAIDKWNSLYGDDYSQMNQDYSISYNNGKGVPTGMEATPMDDGSMHYTYRGQDRGSKPYSQLGNYAQKAVNMRNAPMPPSVQH